MLDKYEQISKEHHKHHYGVEKFKWEWQNVHCLGVWAFGGNNKEGGPVSCNVEVSILVPKPSNESVEGWYCYIGPIPEFNNDQNLPKQS